MKNEDMKDSFQKLITPVYSMLKSTENGAIRARNAATRMIRKSDYFDMSYCSDKTDLGVMSLADKFISFALLDSSDSADILINGPGSDVGIHGIIENHGEDIFCQYSSLGRNGTQLEIEYFIEEFWLSILIKYRRAIMSSSFFSMCILREFLSLSDKIVPPVDEKVLQERAVNSLLFLEKQEGREPHPW